MLMFSGGNVEYAQSRRYLLNPPFGCVQDILGLLNVLRTKCTCLEKFGLETERFPNGEGSVLYQIERLVLSKVC